MILAHLVPTAHAILASGVLSGSPAQPCASPTSDEARYVAVFSTALMVVMTTSLAAFFGWRRLPSPWRSVCFAVFAVSALLIIDVFGYSFAIPDSAATATPTPAPTATHCR